MRQTTLRTTASLQGIGLHSGAPVLLTCHPAPENHGVVIACLHNNRRTPIPAHVDWISHTRMCTTLARGAASIATVEHVLSAVMGCGIDNLLIEVDAPEMPAMDGSALPFVRLFQKIGLQEQDASRRFVCVQKQVEVCEGDKWARLSPHEGCVFAFNIDFEHPAIQATGQTISCDLSTPEAYAQAIAPARTFGFKRDFERLRAARLALGASMDNAIALDDTQILNPEGLRFNDEFVRHKLLDAVGDLALLGHPFLGQYEGFKSGHALNTTLAKALLNDPQAYSIVTFEQGKMKAVA